MVIHSVSLMIVGMMKALVVVPVRAFSDNYIWLLVKGQHAVAVDPGDAAPLQAYLQQHNLKLTAILVTHHHHDHIDGISTLLQQYDVPVYSPEPNHALDFPYYPVKDGDLVDLPLLDIRLKVIDVPGHTAIHVAYYGGNSLFCGDTLFGCGCGRIFDGSCESLHASLLKLAQLPDATQVFCTHEYTLTNIKFALSLDPDNAALLNRQVAAQRLIAQDNPTLPSTMAMEKATNPFLRCHTAAIRKAALDAFPGLAENETAIFCAIRKLRNGFISTL